MDETKRKSVWKMASRLGKTTLLIGCMILQVRNDPCPGGLLFPDEDTRNNTLDGQLYPILDATHYTADQIPRPADRNRFALRFRDCRYRIAVGGSKSSVSGWSARFIGKVEVFKNPQKKSSEADPVDRIDSRAAGFERFVKIIEEGTPTDKTTCRSEYYTNSPDVQRLSYYVPCPHCKTRQVLEFDNIEWEKDEHGRSTKELAARTAFYRCPHCEGEIQDHHRNEMIRAGVWLAEGERIDKRGRISGTPDVNSDTQMFSLSALNSLLIPGWGRLAGEFVEAQAAARQGKVGKLQKFVTEVLAQTWDPQQRKSKPHKVAARLKCDDHPTIQVLPQWTSFLTMTADVGKIAEELIFYWMVTAWGSPFEMPRGAMIDWGVTEGKTDFIKEWKSLAYPMLTLGAEHEPSGELIPVWGQPSGVDSSDFTQEIYDFCRPIKLCLPLKADSRTNATDMYRMGYAKAGLTPKQIALKKKMGRPDLFEPGTDVTQGWRQALVEGRTSSADPGFVSLPGDICEGEAWREYKDFLEELSADQLVDGKWQKAADNEFGDTLRYARALAECYVDGKYRGRWQNLPLISSPTKAGSSRLFERRSGGNASTERFV
jgi:phage terminase large subunit GpA-like protein